MEFVILFLLILINGFFALSEIALVSSKKSKLEGMKKSGKKGAATALRLLENSENFLSAIQVGITLIGIITGVYGGMNLADELAPFFLKIEFTRLYSHEIALVLIVFIITYVSIVIGELVPKTIGLSNPEKISVRVAPIVYHISKVFYPFVKLLSFSTNIISKFLGIKKNNEQITEEELLHLMLTAKNEGLIEMEQHSFHQKLFHFSDKKAKHIMTRRKDIEWIDINSPLIKINEKLLNYHHSKIICCKGNIDNYFGILDTKKYLKNLIKNSEVNIQDYILQAVVIQKNTKAQQILNLLKNQQINICVVINEFDGFEGIITLHDIMESIIGEFPEEQDKFEPEYFVREDKSVLINGDASIEILSDFIENFVVDFEIIEYSTVAGFVLNELHKLPQLGDKFDYMGYRIEIVDMDFYIIDKILLTKI